MLILGPKNWPQHRRWFLASATIAGLATLWYGVASTRAGEWLGGGSFPGLTLGVAGGLIIGFEMLLWPRKKFPLLRVGRATTWMKAHIWLGLLSVPLLLLHSGFHWGSGALSTLLMIEFLAVIASGVWGLALQQVVPRAMLENVPAETIRSQIAPILAQYVEEARQIVRETSGASDRVPEIRQTAQMERRLVIGAVRTVGHAPGVPIPARMPRVAGSEPLIGFFEQTVRPYLEAVSGRRSPLGSEKRARVIFGNARTGLDPAAHDAVARLEDFCDRRRQFDLQSRLHVWLHAWLCIHLPLSASFFLMMLAHIYLALRFA